MKNFCSAKDNVKIVRRHTKEWKKTAARHISKIPAKPLKLNDKKATPLKNGSKTLKTPHQRRYTDDK